MPPKDLIKSMQAYARLLGNALDMIDEILTRVPKGEGGTAPPRVVLQLEDATATAKTKFERMDTNYNIQAVSSELTDEMEKAHTKVYKEAKQRYTKTMQIANAILDARPVGATSNVTVQAAKTPARIVEDLKPSEKLASTMSLEAFRAWAEQYRNFMRQNKKAFEEQGLETARAYLTKAIDSKLSTRLKTLRDEAGNLKVKGHDRGRDHQAPRRPLRRGQAVMGAKNQLLQRGPRPKREF